MPGVDADEMRKQQRAHRVQDMWAQLVSDNVLSHTNNVFIFTKNKTRRMYVYVDESIYAAELNVRQSIIKLRCNTKFHEHIDVFNAYVSRGTWKYRHPYDKLLSSKPQSLSNAPQLDQSEQDFIDQNVAKINNPKLSKALKNAMTSDLRMKKLTDGKKHL